MEMFVDSGDWMRERNLERVFVALVSEHEMFLSTSSHFLEAAWNNCSYAEFLRNFWDFLNSSLSISEIKKITYQLNVFWTSAMDL